MLLITIVQIYQLSTVHGGDNAKSISNVLH